MRTFNWTANRIATLGTTTDRELAQRWSGTNVSAIRRKRLEHGIPAHNPQLDYSLRAHVDGAWTLEALNMIGKDTDTNVGKMIGRSRRTVYTKRTQLGIATFASTKARVKRAEPINLTEIPTNKWPTDIIAQLGTASDRELATKWNLKYDRVRSARVKHQIPTYYQTLRAKLRPFAGTADDETIADRFNTTTSMVKIVRQEYGVPMFNIDKWTNENVALLGTDTDSAIAKKLNLTLGQVMGKRQASNIPSFNKTSKHKVWSQDMDEVIRTNTITRSAIMLDMTVTTITRRAKQLGITDTKALAEPTTNTPIAWTTHMDAMLGTAPDKNIAHELGVSCNSVALRRRDLGIKSYRHSTAKINLTPSQREIALNTELSTYKAGATLGISHMTVHNMRKKANLL
jgi:hypothetical protein